MVTPKCLDVKRCVPLEVYEKWFGDSDVHRVMTKIDPRLKFNADETEMNRKKRKSRLRQRLGVYAML